MLVRAWVRSYGVRATISNCSNNYGPYQHVEKFIPRQITNVLTGRRPKLYGSRRQRAGLDPRRRPQQRGVADPGGRPDRAHVSDWRGRRTGQPVGDAHDPAADGPRPRRLRPCHRPRRPRPAVCDRPVGAVRRIGLGPKHTDFDDGLRATIDWYRDNESWWGPLKDDGRGRPTRSAASERLASSPSPAHGRSPRRCTPIRGGVLRMVHRRGVHANSPGIGSICIRPTARCRRRACCAACTSRSCRRARPST